MLVISRQRNETVMLGDDISVTIVDIRDDKVRLGIIGPRELCVHRKEVYEAIHRENRQAQATLLDDCLVAPGVDLIQRHGIPMGECQIRPAVEEDMAYVNEIYNHYVSTSTCTYQEEPEPLASRRKWFSNHDRSHPIIVAEMGDTVIGWGSLSPYHGRSAYRHTVENSVYVHHQFQKQGIGTTILKDLMSRARAIGHRAIIAGIDAEQSASVALHAKFGFQEVGHLKQVGYKFGRWLDVIYMQLLLT